jgi:hypothetical protein
VVSSPPATEKNCEIESRQDIPRVVAFLKTHSQSYIGIDVRAHNETRVRDIYDRWVNFPRGGRGVKLAPRGEHSLLAPQFFLNSSDFTPWGERKF